MKVLITGGAGFIGSHVAEHFFENQYDVYIVDNLSTGYRKNIPFI
ncbi:NAD-dependent dehydratase, partial [Staphylococcus chromogenes]